MQRQDRGTLLICGGGIAGLTAGLCAHAAGWAPLIIEKAGTLSEVGAGLQVGANAMKVLDRLDLAEAVAAAGHAPSALDLREGESGAQIFSVPAGPAATARWGQPHINIRRAALQSVLASAFEARCPGALRLAGEGVDYTHETGPVRLELADGNIIEGAALIAADGIHSALRARFAGGERPTYTGHTALRVMVEADETLRSLVPDASTAWTGRARHAVTYFLNDRKRVNFVGVVEGREPAPEGWNNSASLEDARAAFAGFAPPVRVVLDAANDARRWGLYDRPAPERLARGRVAMIGDAGLPMPPFMAQGASFAMECAWAAVSDLTRNGSFDSYSAQMALRGARILGAARRNGDLFHGRGLPALAGFAPVKFAARAVPTLIRQRFDWIYGYDATREWPLTA